MKVKICKNDMVEVISGNNLGHRGTVQRVIRKKHKNGLYDPNRVYVIVSGANIVKKHQKATSVRTQTGIIEKEAPIHISNVMLVGSDGQPTRVGYDISESGEKSRVSRQSRTPLPKTVD